MSDGVKYDEGKDRWDLLPFAQVRKVVKILTFGASKYSPNNWQKVDNARERYTAAAFRHLTAWCDGDRIDSESGITHLAHAVCNLLFLMWFEDADNSQSKRRRLDSKSGKRKNKKLK